MAESYSLLRDAYAIIDGIPDARINLYNWYTFRGKATDCKTIACAAGWLALHPDFESKFDGCYQNSAYIDRLEEIFNLTYDEVYSLFGPRSWRDFDQQNKNLSDKQLWLDRVRHFLKSKE